MKHFFIILLLVLITSQCRPKTENYITQFPGKPEMPAVIKEEHDYLLEQIQRFSLFPDSTGRVALRTFELMRHHFKEEEDYVLPPLKLLPELASGNLPENSAPIISLTDKLRSQLAHMNAEHQMIKVHLEELKLAAARENHPEILEFEKSLHAHAKTEEEIYFPAALVVGEFLKLQSAKKP